MQVLSFVGLLERSALNLNKNTQKKQRTRLTNASMVSKKLGSYHPCVACNSDINVDFLA